MYFSQLSVYIFNYYLMLVGPTLTLSPARAAFFGLFSSSHDGLISPYIMYMYHTHFSYLPLLLLPPAPFAFWPAPTTAAEEGCH